MKSRLASGSPPKSWAMARPITLKTTPTQPISRACSISAFRRTASGSGKGSTEGAALERSRVIGARSATVGPVGSERAPPSAGATPSSSPTTVGA